MTPAAHTRSRERNAATLALLDWVHRTPTTVPKSSLWTIVWRSRPVIESERQYIREHYEFAIAKMNTKRGLKVKHGVIAPVSANPMYYAKLWFSKPVAQHEVNELLSTEAFEIASFEMVLYHHDEKRIEAAESFKSSITEFKKIEKKN